MDNWTPKVEKITLVKQAGNKQANDITETNRIVFSEVQGYLDGKECQTQTIFDNGCNGAQADLTSLMLNTGMEIVGLDENEDWVKEKGARFGRFSNLKLVVGDSHHLPFKDEVFDIVIMSDVIEHLDKPDVALKELHHCLKNNGKLILATLNTIGLWSLATDRLLFWLRNARSRICGRRRLKRTWHVSFFTLRSLKECLASQNLNVEKVISPEGLGIAMFTQALFIKCHLPILGRRGGVIGHSHLIYAIIHALDCKISKLIPLWLHSEWVIIAGKNSRKQEDSLLKQKYFEE